VGVHAAGDRRNEHELVTRVILPGALPSIMTGVRLSMGIAWVLVVVAEILAVRSGLGYLLNDAYLFYRNDVVIAAMLSIGCGKQRRWIVGSAGGIGCHQHANHFAKHPAVGPEFGDDAAEVAAPPVVWKEKHLKLMVRQNGRALALKAWNFAERAAELGQGTRVDIAFAIEEDAYSAARGYPAWCAVLRDFRAVV
jgi:hypothetical protein